MLISTHTIRDKQNEAQEANFSAASRLLYFKGDAGSRLGCGIPGTSLSLLCKATQTKIVALGAAHASLKIHSPPLSLPKFRRSAIKTFRQQ
jgi:hypothetical protein